MKIHKQYHLFKQISVDFFGNNSNSSFKGATSRQRRGSGWSLRSKCCWRNGVLLVQLITSKMGFSAIEPISKSLKFDGGKELSIPC